LNALTMDFFETYAREGRGVRGKRAGRGQFKYARRDIGEKTQKGKKRSNERKNYLFVLDGKAVEKKNLGCREEGK